jgi:katanin p60 ATPase-containing subunit A1
MVCPCMQGEHEASRRMKTELLLQMDALRPEHRVFVLAATNLPWELDLALLRRLEKRILVALPSPEARRRILVQALAGRVGTDVDLGAAAETMRNYSGSDVIQVAREAAMRPLRRLLAAADAQHVAEGQLEAVGLQDMHAAISAVRCTSHGHQAKYEDFARMFGSSASI